MKLSCRITDFLREFGIYVLIFIVVFALRVGAISQKTNFFFDDPTSFSASTPNNMLKDGTKIKYGWADLRFYPKKEYTVLEIKEVLFKSSAKPKDIWNDLVFLHKKTLDHQHPNLYYSILRVWTIGMDYSDSHAMMIRGCSLNLIFFIFAYFFMYRLLSLIKNDKKFIALGLFFAFTATGSISNSLLIRSYPMFEAFFILSLYMFLKMYLSVGKNTTFSKKRLLKYTLGFAGLFLTAYYSLFLGCFIFITLAYKSIQAKDYKFLKNLLLIFASAFIIVYLFCPVYFSNFRTIEHMHETKEAFNTWNILNFYYYGQYMLEILSKFLFNNAVFYLILFALAIIGLPIFDKNRFSSEELKRFGIVCGTTYLYMYFIVTICPFHEHAASRYVIYCISSASLLLAFITYYLRIGHAVAMALITLTACTIPITSDINMWNSQYKNIGIVANFKDYNELNHSGLTYKGNRKRPVVIANRNWIWTNYVLYLDNNDIIRFENYVPDENFVYDDYVLINKENASIVTK